MAPKTYLEPLETAVRRRPRSLDLLFSLWTLQQMDDYIAEETGIHPGNVIALLDAGAYLESSANNFNALPRPATVLVHGDKAEVIKRAETIDDVYSRDFVPERLQ